MSTTSRMINEVKSGSDGFFSASKIFEHELWSSFQQRNYFLASFFKCVWYGCFMDFFFIFHKSLLLFVIFLIFTLELFITTDLFYVLTNRLFGVLLKAIISCKINMLQEQKLKLFHIKGFYICDMNTSRWYINANDHTLKDAHELLNFLLFPLKT